MNKKIFLIFFIFISVITTIVFAQKNNKKHPTNIDPNLHVSYGKYIDYVRLSWDKSDPAEKYVIYRSNQQEGPFNKLDESSNNVEQFIVYNDYSAEPGILYYYTINPSIGKEEIKTTDIKPGYRKIDVNKKYDLGNLTDEKNEPMPVLSEIDKKRINQIEGLYMGWLRIQFLLMMTKPYIYKGSVIVLSDLQNFTSDRLKNEISIISPGETFQINFTSTEPFDVLEKTKDNELFNILIKNGIAFCIYQGDVKIKLSNGNTKFIPRFEAICIATQYFKNYKKWSTSTILFKTSRTDLVDKMKQIENAD